ncbi:MAG TPA: phosphopentomutase [Myxococcales bacterium]|nr:phosphopentomutase [Myxococcales bacterium]
MGRFVILVIDSCGAGALPDAAEYGDEGANTLGNMARRVGGLHLPTLESWGLGNLTEIAGCPPSRAPRASFGTMAELSRGKDTTTGHWEMVGVVLEKGFATFPHGFPPELMEEWLRLSGAPGYLGNKPASGTEIIEELGPQHLATGWPIVYTSADSVFQIAAHEQRVPLATLYKWCEAARTVGTKYGIARVIARPFIGEPGKFVRTYNRRDFSQPPPPGTVLDLLAQAGVQVVGVGKIPDIYDGRGIARSVHTEGNADGLRKTEELLGDLGPSLLFVNLVDTDMLYGHRRDPVGYARAMEEIDRALPGIASTLRSDDVLVITADHGNDPTFPGSDHTREQVPVLAYSPRRTHGSRLGVRESFADLGATVAEYFGVKAPRGRSFLAQVAA